jgi:hypothetical protein
MAPLPAPRPLTFGILWGGLELFDFSDEVERAVHDATDDASRLSARTLTGRKLFPHAVVRAGFSLMQPGDPLVAGGGEHVIVVAVSTWSDPDLATLEELARNVRNRPVRVLVRDTDDWGLADVLRTFPGAKRFLSTPFVLQYKGGALTFSGEGPEARFWLGQI